MRLTLRVLIVTAMASLLGCGGGGGLVRGGGSGGTVPTAGCSELGLGILSELNAYRGLNGLPPIPVSESLCFVAATHVNDLALNHPDQAPGCNLHSWSDQGTWSACCYTPDHAQSQCMWDKPRELTIYSGNGNENAAFGHSTPAAVLRGWANSSLHNDVLLNRGIWSDTTWRAVGAAMAPGGYATIWFGSEADPAP